MTSDLIIRAHGLRKQYGRDGGLVRAVDGIDLAITQGETVAVMGPSGCGKSTLLHLIGGLDRPSGATCGSVAGGSTSSASGTWPSCGGRKWDSSSRTSICWRS